MARLIRPSEPDQCTCLKLRKAARALTRVYDAALGPSSLTIGQFGLLAHLYGRRDGVAIGELGELIGADPTTVNRLLKPLERDGLVVNAVPGPDRRVRTVKISRKGAANFRRALPLWHDAQRRTHDALGRDAVNLGRLLETVAALR
jgi:DNA-binding MarR family transcriptional regulator